MEDRRKTKSQLIKELEELRKRIETADLCARGEETVSGEGPLCHAVRRPCIEEALRRSEDKFTKVFMLSPLAVVLTRLADGTMLDVNESFLSIMGYERREVVGRSSAELKNWADPGHRAAFARVLAAQGHIDEMETAFRTRDGRIIPAIISGKMIEIDGETCVLSVTCDITEHKRMEDELKFRNVILSTQQDVSIDGTLVVDEKGEMILSNKRFAEMWGIPRDVMLSRSDDLALQFVMDKLADPAEFLDKVQYLYQARHERSRDEILLADGRVFDRYSSPMLSAEGKYYGRVWSFRDITDERRAERERERLILELREALSQVNTLSGLLPICASCKKIRNDKGYWEQVEVYISHHSGAEFSHSLCPECARRLYPEVYEDG